MAKHQVDIEIIASSNQVSLYVIDDEGLEKLIQNSKSDTPLKFFEILDSLNYVEYHHICDGIDPTIDYSEMKFMIDGKSIDINDVLSISGFDDAELENIENCLVYDDENVTDLEGSIPQGKHAIVVSEWFKDGVLKASFETDSLIKPCDLRLEFVTLDGPSDFSECTYHLGTSGPVDYDLRSVLFDNNSYEFSFSCSNFKSREIYLIVGNKSEGFQISPLSEELF